MVKVFNHRPKAEVVRKALEEAREALANGALPSRVLPTPGPEYQAWGPGEVRTAALLSAHLWNVLDLSLETAADLSIHQRLLEVADELNLGYWVQELPRVQALVRPGDKRVPAKEAGKQVARGIPVQCQQAREEAYLLQVAYWSRRFAQEAALRERVEKLITTRPGAKVTPKDLKVILGRVRSGKEVWIKASEKERQEVIDQVVRQLAKEEKAFLSPEWRWDGDGVHPRIRLALQRIRTILEEEKPEEVHEDDLDTEDRPHFSPLREAEELVLRGLGESWDNPVQARGVLEKWVEFLKEAIRGKEPLKLILEGLDSLELKIVGEEIPVSEAGEVEDPMELLRFLASALRRISPKTRRAQDPLRAVRWFLKEVELIPQRRLKRLMGKRHRDAVKAVAMEAAIGALEVLLTYPGLWEDAVYLAYDLGREAALNMRSPNHHPAAYAARKARDRAPYYLELTRQAVALDELTASALFRLRRVYQRHPSASLEELAFRARLPVEWVEQAMLLIIPQSHLEDSIGEDLVVGDTLAGGEDPADIVERKAVQAAVRKALGELPEYLRQVVELVDLEGLPVEDAARELGLPLEEVEARRSLAHNELRYLLMAWRDRDPEEEDQPQGALALAA